LTIATIRDNFTHLKQRMKSKDENLEGRLNHARSCDLEEMGTTQMKHQMLFFHGRGNRLWKTDVGVPLKKVIFELGFLEQKKSGVEKEIKMPMMMEI